LESAWAVALVSDSASVSASDSVSVSVQRSPLLSAPASESEWRLVLASDALSRLASGAMHCCSVWR